MIWIIHFDGGIRGGNPGGVPTYGVTITDGEGVVLHSMCGVIHTEHRTNNVAEWTALANGLIMAWAHRHRFSQLIIRGDSQLVIRQLGGEYSVNAEHLKPIFTTCRNVLDLIGEYIITHIPVSDDPIKLIWNRRDKNEEADALAGQAYDTYIESGGKR